MSSVVDRRLFEELAQRTTTEIIHPPFCLHDGSCYIVEAWGEKYRVDPVRQQISYGQKQGQPHEYFSIFLANYLLSEKRAQPFGKWISEKDLTGGVTFFRGPHEIPTKLISAKFVNDLDALANRCQSLGGERLDMADFSCSFAVLGSIHLALLYWLGDQDFPAEAKLLFDSSVAETLPLDVVFGLLCDACFRISQK